ncbi:unnamed protein product [Protopolystoma xenopodis]|uniref:Uncharacterized protein n=1 Tax=Protopolystoma xenopodis TaxID=117903 RepID=A0A3S4ZAP7_9PLAT|nr:unnamed protein product [Protopolystoma xenopodis]
MIFHCVLTSVQSTRLPKDERKWDDLDLSKLWSKEELESMAGQGRDKPLLLRYVSQEDVERLLEDLGDYFALHGRIRITTG